MTPEEKLKLLQSVRLLDQIPARQLGALGEFLKPLEFADGDAIFEEGSKGESLYFVTSGNVRISKRASGGEAKDLAILGPGDCFGEMALLEDVARSATATASGAAGLFELSRADMNRWLKSNPELAVDFLNELVQVQSKRLRRTSSELTLLFDLSSLLLDQTETDKELLSKVLAHLMPHIEGSWSSAAYLYNVFNDEMDFTAGTGGFDFAALQDALPPATETRSLWLDPSTYYVSLPSLRRPLGYLIFRSQSPLADDDRAELGRTLSTVARLLTSALENINYRTDESLRARLKARHHGTGF